MSEMGRTAKITGVLDKSLDAGALIPVNKNNKVKFYCPNCYATSLYYREIESDVFDLTCLTCHKHWIKHRKVEIMQK